MAASPAQPGAPIRVRPKPTRAPQPTPLGSPFMSDDNWQAIETQIRDAVDQHFDEQIDYLAEIVRFPSVRGAEHTLQDFFAADMAQRGLAVDRWQIRVEDIQDM